MVIIFTDAYLIINCSSKLAAALEMGDYEYWLMKLFMTKILKIITIIEREFEENVSAANTVNSPTSYQTKRIVAFFWGRGHCT